MYQTDRMMFHGAHKTHGLIILSKQKQQINRKYSVIWVHTKQSILLVTGGKTKDMTKVSAGGKIGVCQWAPDCSSRPHPIVAPHSPTRGGSHFPASKCLQEAAHSFTPVYIFIYLFGAGCCVGFFGEGRRWFPKSGREESVERPDCCVCINATGKFCLATIDLNSSSILQSILFPARRFKVFHYGPAIAATLYLCHYCVIRSEWLNGALQQSHAAAREWDQTWKTTAHTHARTHTGSGDVTNTGIELNYEKKKTFSFWSVFEPSGWRSSN